MSWIASPATTPNRRGTDLRMRKRINRGMPLIVNVKGATPGFLSIAPFVPFAVQEVEQFVCAVELRLDSGQSPDKPRRQRHSRETGVPTVIGTLGGRTDPAGSPWPARSAGFFTRAAGRGRLAAIMGPAHRAAGGASG